jgi:predicted nucleotidyltransferase component of viral defense system
MMDKAERGRSFQGKLRNVARDSKKTVQVTNMLYLQEAFLRRLGLSSYTENFILKGGLYLYSVTRFKSRPTKDTDLTGRRITNDTKKLVKIIGDICMIKPDHDDGVEFLVEEIYTEVIMQEMDYGGVRIKIPCKMGTMKEKVTVEISFGDEIVPDPQMIFFPTLFPDVLNEPEIMVYSMESVIAEKFDAMIDRGEANTRMKDLYDIYILSQEKTFEGLALYEAIKATFTRRETNATKKHVVFTQEYRENTDVQKLWRNFASGLQHSDLTFDEVMVRIENFLKPVYDHVVEAKEYFAHWDTGEFVWKL